MPPMQTTDTVGCVGVKREHVGEMHSSRIASFMFLLSMISIFILVIRENV